MCVLGKPPLRPYHPTPLELSGHIIEGIFWGDFFLELQENRFLSGQALIPPLNSRDTKKKNFLRLP